MAKRIVIGIWIVLAMFLGILLLADYSNNKMIESFKNGEIEQNQLGFLGFTQPYVNHYNRGNIYYTLGDFQRAISEYEQALNSSPSAPEDCRIRVNYALALVKQINPATASENLDETLELLREAREILCAHECACEDSEDGHFTYAQRLKDEIDAYEWQLLNPTSTPTPTPTPTNTPTPTPDPNATPQPDPSQKPDPSTPSPTPDPDLPTPTPDPNNPPEPTTPTPQPEPTQDPNNTATPTPQPEPTQDPNNTATPTPQPENPDPGTPTPAQPSPGPSGTPVVTPTPPPPATPTMTPEEEILEIQRRAQNERHPDMAGDGSLSDDYNWGSSACW